MVPYGKIAIYSLIDKTTKECLYVGQTVDPAQRCETHNNPFSGKRGNYDFVIWGYCDPKNANGIETLLIQGYKDIGQAKLNRKQRGSYPRGSTNSCYSVMCQNTGMIFDGYSDVARYYGCSGQTVSNAIKYHGGRLMVLDRGCQYVSLKVVRELYARLPD